MLVLSGIILDKTFIIWVGMANLSVLRRGCLHTRYGAAIAPLTSSAPTMGKTMLSNVPKLHWELRAASLFVFVRNARIPVFTSAKRSFSDVAALRVLRWVSHVSTASQGRTARTRP